MERFGTVPVVSRLVIVTANIVSMSSMEFPVFVRNSHITFCAFLHSDRSNNYLEAIAILITPLGTPKQVWIFINETLVRVIRSLPNEIDMVIRVILA